MVKSFRGAHNTNRTFPNFILANSIPHYPTDTMFVIYVIVVEITYAFVTIKRKKNKIQKTVCLCKKYARLSLKYFKNI